MNADWVAEVYCGTYGARGQKDYTGIATGYPVARDRVITAGHILEEGRGFVEVRFRNSKEPDPILVSKAWDLRPDFDVAVLECTIPKDIGQDTPLRFSPHNRIGNGECMGYPWLNKAQQKSDGQRKLKNLAGKVAALEGTSNDFEFQAQFDLGPEEKIDKGWRGISGAPLFVNHELVGLLAECLEYATVAHFKVVAMCRLLRCEKFREALGATYLRDDHRRSVEPRVRSILGKMAGEDAKMSRSTRLLELSLRDDVSDLDELDMTQDPTETIVEGLFRPDFGGTVAKLNGAYEQLSVENSEAANLTARLIDHLTPWLIPDELAEAVWQAMATGQSLFRADSSKAAMIETIMALADRKEVRIARPEEMPAHDFFGKPSLRIHKPKSGATAPGTEALAKEFLSDLCESEQIGDPKSQNQSLEHLVGRFIGMVIFQMGRLENRLRTVYVIHWLPQNPKEAELHVQALELIASELKKAKSAPGVTFVLARESSSYEAEQEIWIRTLRSRFSPKTKVQP